MRQPVIAFPYNGKVIDYEPENKHADDVLYFRSQEVSDRTKQLRFSSRGR